MAKLRGSSGDPERDMERRQALIDGSLPQLFSAFDEGIDEGLDDPAVALIDCEDEIGAPFARAWVGDEAVDAALAEQSSAGDDDLTVTLALTFDFLDIRRDFPEYFPYLAAALREPPPLDGFLAIIIAGGGAGAFTVPFSERNTES